MNAAENPNLTRTVPPADPAQLPPDIRRDIEVILPLATSGFLDHFLESFLAKAGRLFRLPWWLVHAALYALVAIVAAVWVDQRKFFPRGGSLTLCGILAAEFVFTTWMLVHIRQSRTLALLAVARLNSGHDRLTWLRTFFGPMHWGWVIRGRSRPANHSKPLRLRLPALTLLLVIAFYVDLLMWGVEPGRHEAWETCQAHLLGLYTLIAKAAMLLAVLAHFWLLRGFVKLLRGAWPNSLTDSARARLWAETRHNAVRLNLIAGATAALWMFVHGLGVGITHWAYLLSLGLLALLVTQGVILDGRMVRSAAVAGTFRPMFVLALSTLRQVSLAYGRAEACAALFLIACPVLANSIGATINRLASP